MGLMVLSRGGKGRQACTVGVGALFQVRRGCNKYAAREAYKHILPHARTSTHVYYRGRICPSCKLYGKRREARGSNRKECSVPGTTEVTKHTTEVKVTNLH